MKKIFLLGILVFFLTGCFSEEKFKVDFFLTGDSEIDSVEVQKGDSVELIEPILKGYTFLGWYSDMSYQNEFTSSTPITENTCLYAKWEINKYTLSFDSVGGSDVTPIIADYNENIAEPEPPTKDYFTFLGWFKEPECLNSFIFFMMPSEDITVYAKWKPNVFNISFETNGGNSISDLQVEYHTEVETPIPVRGGYVFLGWFEDEALQIPFNTELMPSNNLVLYAKWNNDLFTINFDSQGGSEISSEQYYYQEQIKEPLKPFKENYIFVGWYLDKECNKIFDLSLMPAHDLIVFAKWVDYYTISFDANGGTEIPNLTSPIGSPANEPNAPKKEGHSFIGWYEDEELSSPFDFTVPHNQNYQLYAKWLVNQYQMTLIDGDLSDTFTFDFMEPLELYLPSKENLDFKGWWLDSEGLISFTEQTMPASDLILYSKWATALTFFDYQVTDYLAIITGAKENIPKDIIIPDEINNLPVKTIGPSAFKDLIHLESVIFPHTLTTIGAFAFNNCTGLHEINLPDNLTTIEGRAFGNCSNLQSINFGNSLKSINSYAFRDCVSLESLELPDSLITIDNGVLSGCSNLKIIKMPIFYSNFGALFGDIFGNLEFEKAKLISQKRPGGYSSTCYFPISLNEVIISGSRDIPEFFFSNIDVISNITIENSVKKIGQSAFSGCSGLREMHLPFVGEQAGSNTTLGYIFGTAAYPNGKPTKQGLITYYLPVILKTIQITNNNRIPSYAFMNSNLENISIPLATTIGDEAFYGCTYLKNIVLPDQITMVGSQWFYNCQSLEEIELPENITKIGTYAFGNCLNLQNINLDNVKGISFNAFTNCQKLSYISVPNVEEIYDQAFSESGLYEIYLPESLKILGKEVFYNCRRLREANIPSQINELDQGLFKECSNLTNITLHDGISVFKRDVFRGCGFSAFTIPQGLTTLGDFALAYCPNLKEISIPDHVTQIGICIFQGCFNLEKISLPYLGYSIEEPCSLFNLFDGENYLKLQEVIIAGGNTLVDRAFHNFKGISKIILPNSIITIGKEAFKGCIGLQEIIIPDSVQYIGEMAFDDCINLQRMTLPFVGTSRDAIGEEAFFGNIFGIYEEFGFIRIFQSNGSINKSYYIPGGLTEVIITATNTLPSGAFSGCITLKTIVLPEQLKKIDYYCFKGCIALENIALPNSLATIGQCAFQDCQAIEEIFIPLPVAEIRQYAFYGCFPLRICCEANTKPDGWETLWDSGIVDIQWGCTRPD